MVKGGDFDNSRITGNIIDNCKNQGIELYGCNNTISGNLIDTCNEGISLDGHNNTISGNIITNQTVYRLFSKDAGFRLKGSDNQIINNNFYNNWRNAISYSSPRDNLWDSNYWDTWIGFNNPQLDFLPYIDRYIIWFIIDWNPAKEPYDIGG
jgi:parallel beta-helix repeat protein